MNVLVTGGCGYIGSRLVPQLQDDPRVDTIVVFDDLSTGSPRNLIGACIGVDESVAFRQGDVREYGAVESVMQNIDTVIHLAGITGANSTHDRPEETAAVNLNGTKNVLTAAKKFDVSNVVFASSCNNYGRAASTDIDEETTPDPINPYAETKYKAEGLLAEYVTDGHFDGTALRMSTNYGYAIGIRFNLVINHFVFRALTNRPLTVYGDGRNWRPYIHVTDAARAFKHAALSPRRWSELLYNVGSNDENYRVAEIAEIVRDVVNADLDVTYLKDKQPGPSYHVNFDRLATTGFETEWTVREGVQELVEIFEGTDENATYGKPQLTQR